MDIASLVSIFGGFVIIIFGILSSGASVMSYIDMPSVIITFGGAIMATLGCYKFPEFINAQKALPMMLKEPKITPPAELIKTIIDLSQTARKEGLLALDQMQEQIEDPFLKKGVRLIVDGTDQDVVRGILEAELDGMEERHKKVWGVWDKLGEMGPAWGMIGTLIGLINMLKDLSDTAALGPNMAVALITTLYGSFLVNWLGTPISGKLQENNANEVKMKTIMIEGLLSIQAGENPHIIEEKLKTFLAPGERDSLGSAEEGKGEAGASAGAGGGNG